MTSFCRCSRALAAIILSAVSKVFCTSSALRLDLHLAGFDLGHVEQIVDQAEQMRARRMDVAGIFVVARRPRPGPKHSCRDDLGKAENGVQRRAQLVAHIGEKRRLGGIGGLGLEALAQRLVAGFFEFARQILHFEAKRVSSSSRRVSRAPGDEELRSRRRAMPAPRRNPSSVAAEHEAQRRDCRHRHRLATSISIWLARLITSFAIRQHTQTARKRWLMPLPLSHSSHGVSPQPALIAICMREEVREPALDAICVRSAKPGRAGSSVLPTTRRNSDEA